MTFTNDNIDRRSLNKQSMYFMNSCQSRPKVNGVLAVPFTIRGVLPIVYHSVVLSSSTLVNNSLPVLHFKFQIDIRTYVHMVAMNLYHA